MSVHGPVSYHDAIRYLYPMMTSLKANNLVGNVTLTGYETVGSALGERYGSLLL